MQPWLSSQQRQITVSPAREIGVLEFFASRCLTRQSPVCGAPFTPNYENHFHSITKEHAPRRRSRSLHGFGHRPMIRSIDAPLEQRCKKFGKSSLWPLTLACRASSSYCTMYAWGLASGTALERSSELVASRWDVTTTIGSVTLHSLRACVATRNHHGTAATVVRSRSTEYEYSQHHGAAFRRF